MDSQIPTKFLTLEERLHVGILCSLKYSSACEQVRNTDFVETKRLSNTLLLPVIARNVEDILKLSRKPSSRLFEMVHTKRGLT